MASIAYPSIAKKATLSDGTTYGYARVEAKEGKPTVLFLHGYPSSSYDWHHQVDYLSKKGYGLVVPDLLGYGDTSVPAELEKYTMVKIGRQVVEILDKEGVDKVVGVGHDWGSALLSSMARQHKDRFSSFVFLAVSYMGQPFGDIDELNKMTKEMLGYSTFGYWYFHDAEDAPAVIKAHADSYLHIIYPEKSEAWLEHLCPPGAVRKYLEADTKVPVGSWLTQEERDMHQKIFKGDYTGGLNWYKQEMRGYGTKDEAGLKDEARHIDVPLLFVRAENDVVCVPDVMIEMTKPFVKNLHTASLQATHWAQLEKADEFNSILEKWLTTGTA